MGDLIRTIIRWIIPVIIASFPALLYAWPCFSVINKEKTNTIITVVCAGVQIIGIVIVMVADMFTLIALAVVRSIVEVILAIARVVAIYKYRKQFNGEKDTSRDNMKENETI